MIKAVIFDMDGVVFDTEKLLIKYWCIAANEFGFPMKREQALTLRSLSGKLAAPLLKEMFGDDFDYLTVRARRMELMNAHLAANPLEIKAGFFTLTDYLRDKGITVAMATATDYERASAYLKRGGIFERFDKIICASMVERGKPAPDVYLYAAERAGFSPSECLAVEDSPNGVRSASSAGCVTVMVPDLTQPDEELLGLIYRKCDALGEVVGVIDELNGR